MNVKEILKLSSEYLSKNNNILSPKIDAELLIGHVLKLNRLELYLQLDKPLIKTEIDRIRELIKLRKQLMPVAYLTGNSYFYGFEFSINKGVFIPKQETEVMIDIVADYLKRDTKLMFCDAGTGSGIILCSVLKLFTESKGIGIDINPDALKLSAKNAVKTGVENRSKWILSDWFNFIKDGIKFDCILSNPPYVDGIEQLSEEVKKYEPMKALISEDSGMKDLKEIILTGFNYLKDNGIMICETAEYHSRKILEFAQNNIKKKEVKIFKDLAGRDRFIFIKKM